MNFIFKFARQNASWEKRSESRVEVCNTAQLKSKKKKKKNMKYYQKVEIYVFTILHSPKCCAM